MNNNNLHLTIDGREITLIGTAHVSQTSIDEVLNVIKEEKPGLVCVELDQGRYDSISKKDTWEKLDIFKVLKEGKGFLLIANLVLTGFQRRMGNQLGVKPGDEMKIAIETAVEMGIPFRLCDREVRTTLQRAWARCGLWSKCKLLATLFASAFSTEKLSAEEIENLKNHSELDGMMNEISEYLPEVKETLIDERDLYLAANIWKAAKETDKMESKHTIAVVGAGHLQGIKSHIEKIAAGNDADISELDVIPPPRVSSKIAAWIIPIIILSLVGIGVYKAGAAFSMEALVRWVLINGSLAAIGSIIALGHPLAIIAAFLGAPITSFIPGIGIGIITGLIQAGLHKPRVTDAENISEDVSSLKGIYRNRISRTLLVFFLSSIGSAIGTFVGGAAIVELFVGAIK